MYDKWRVNKKANLDSIRFGPENREHPGGVLHSLPNPVPVTIPRASLCCPTYSGTWDFSTIQTLDQRRIGNLVTCYVSCSDHWRIHRLEPFPIHLTLFLPPRLAFGKDPAIDHRDQSAVPLFFGKTMVGVSRISGSLGCSKAPSQFHWQKMYKKVVYSHNFEFTLCSDPDWLSYNISPPYSPFLVIPLCLLVNFQFLDGFHINPELIRSPQYISYPQYGGTKWTDPRLN